jgi:SPP1 gp7 family putative phage head morphogenesis protein
VVSAEADLEFSLAQVAIGAGAAPRAVLRELQDHWGQPFDELRKSSNLLKAKDDDKPTKPGDHGIPEIARSEKAFYRALTAGQKEAYRAIADLVDTLFRQGKGWAGVDPWRLDEPIEEWKRKAFNELATHPMQAYMLGQVLAQEAVGGGIARPLVPTDREAIKYLEHTTFNELDSSFDRFKGELRSRLIEGMQNGDNPKEIARDLRRTFKENEADFELISITENTRAEAQGRLNELQDSGVKFAIGSSSHDRKTCDFCRANIDGKRVRVSDTVGLSNYGRKKEDWVRVIPAHPRRLSLCVAPVYA